jgi:superfamily II DNA or RNA helicase
MELRPYQNQLANDIRGAFSNGSKRPLAVSPTGSGKTVLFSYITSQVLKRGSRVIIVAHRREILDQISATLKRVGVPHGFIQAGKSMAKLSVMVASVQTLARRLDAITPPDLVIVDEAHHSVSNSYVQMFAAWPNAKFIGVTATPERLDGKGLGAMFDRMVMGPSVQWLIDNGFLARPVYYAPKQSIDLSKVHKVAGDFDRREVAELVDTPRITGDAVAHYCKLIKHQRAVAFCISVAHAQHVAEQFCAAGIPAASIDGTLDPETRKRRVNDLTSGKILVLTSCELISEGFDLPAVNAAILLRPTHSLSLHLQQLGRALRPYPGKTQAVILDHVGNCLRHGLAEQEREWDLDGREKRLKKSNPVETKQCSKCFAIFAGTTCPQCGTQRESAPREVEQVDGELKKITIDDIAARRNRLREESQCKTLKDFQMLAQERHYHIGWAYYRWKARQKKTSTVKGAPRKVSIQTIKDRRRFNHYAHRWPDLLNSYAGNGVCLSPFSEESCQLNPNSKPSYSGRPAPNRTSESSVTKWARDTLARLSEIPKASS